MPEMTLVATKRDVFGKKTRFLRRQGMTPAHLFGHGLESQALQCDTADLIKIISRAGTTRILSLKVEGEKEPKNVFVREVQRDILNRQLLHVDFYQVKKGEKMQMDIPIVLVGEAPAMKGKGRLLSRGVTELKIECLPEKVPPQIEVDISILADLEHSICVKDIVLDPDITVHDDPQQLIVKVTEITIKAEEERPAAAAEAEAPEGEAKAEEGAAEPAAESEKEE